MADEREGSDPSSARRPRFTMSFGNSHTARDAIHELGELAAAGGLLNVGQRLAVSAITPCYGCDNGQRGEHL